MHRGLWLACLLVVLATGPAIAIPPVDATTQERIVDAGFNHGQVVEIAEYLADQVGGRLTGSPALRAADAWAQTKMGSWGLHNVHQEAFNFGRGWWIERASTRVVAPRPLDVRSIPIAWTPPTSGTITVPVVVAPMRTERDFATWHGKLAGKLVLVSWPEPAADETEPPSHRFVDGDVSPLGAYPIPHADSDEMAERVTKLRFTAALDEFLAAEGAAAWAQMSRLDGRLVHGEGYAYQRDRTPRLPALEIAAEDCRRIARLARVGEVRVEIDSRVHFDDSDPNAYNLIGDIPGRDPHGGYVMAGAHLDSWVAGDGAADNAAGAAVVLEAARILASLGIQPRRTIRFALWSGEEQGLLGSEAYIEEHIAHRPRAADPFAAAIGNYYAGETYPIQLLPGYADLAAYFNIDNGSGRIRGIRTEGNFGAGPILRDWFGPLVSLGASWVIPMSLGSTDHVLFGRLGLPAFQFIQDPLDYRTRVHHTDLDLFDHLRIDDLRQAAVVLAVILVDAANFEVPLPRKTLPTAPRPVDPFRYSEPPK